MRHRKGIKKLGKPTDQRIALLRSLVIALFENNRIKTTDARAKEAKRMAEKLITLGKSGDVNARRRALQILPNKDSVKVIFNTAPKYKDRNGGYTRIYKLGIRKGDAAKISLLELVE